MKTECCSVYKTCYLWNEIGYAFLCKMFYRLYSITTCTGLSSMYCPATNYYLSVVHCIK